MGFFGYARGQQRKRRRPGFLIGVEAPGPPVRSACAGDLQLLYARPSEMTGLKREDIVLGTGAHVTVVGKGRKERCTPLSKHTLAVLRAWLREPQRGNTHLLFPSARGEQMSVHGVQYLLNKHRITASCVCPSLQHKRVTVHRLRHTMAMDLLQAGVDRSVIALWLGHERVETTQMYLEATLAMKEIALQKVSPRHGKPGRFKPGDQLLAFLNA